MRLIQAIAVASAFAAALAGAPFAAAQEHVAGPHPIEGTLLSVSVDGASQAAPDMAAVSLGVTTEGATAAAALADNARRMNALTQALRRAGIAERDIQTSNISVSPQYAYVENEPPRLTSYQANNTLNARVRNLAALGAVIDSAVGAGGNTVNGVSFSHQNPDAQLDAARRDAATEARRRADLYASAFGLHVQRIIAISEGGGYSPPVPMIYAARMSADAAPTPVSPGEIETRVTLSVTFELR